MSPRIVLASAVLAFGCGNRHESPRPSEQSSQRTPADAPSPPDAIRAASTPVADAAPVAITTPTRAPKHLPPTMRCSLRITAKGIYVDGVPKSQPDAVVACRKSSGALVAVEDNAPPGEWKALQAALQRAGVPILMRGTVNDPACVNNPLSKGCN